MRPFGFLTNHGLALLCIARDPETRMRDIAADVQITERAAQRIVAELIDAGYLDRERIGRRNHYTVRLDLPVSLPAQRDVDLNSLLNVRLPVLSSDERKHAMPHEANADDLARKRSSVNRSQDGEASASSPGPLTHATHDPT